MDKGTLFVTKCVMFALLGLLLFAAGLTACTWQFHAIALWGLVATNIGG